jgi:hypothetical protein
MQTTDGGDTAALRMRDMKTNSVHIRVEEEQSKDKETAHTTEVVGYLAIWGKQVAKKDLLEDDSDVAKTVYVRRYPLQDSSIYVRTGKFYRNAIKYRTKLHSALYDRTPARGYCERYVEDMDEVSNVKLCKKGVNRYIGFHSRVVIPSAQKNTFCFKLPTDFDNGAQVLWDGQVVKSIRSAKKTQDLGFCVNATAGNHILEVYFVSKSSQVSTQWTFRCNGAEW